MATCSWGVAWVLSCAALPLALLVVLFFGESISREGRVRAASALCALALVFFVLCVLTRGQHFVDEFGWLSAVNLALALLMVQQETLWASREGLGAELARLLRLAPASALLALALGLAGREVLSWGEFRSTRGLVAQLAELPALRTAIPWPLACGATLFGLSQLLFLGWPQRGKGSRSTSPLSPSSLKRTSPGQEGTTTAA